MNVLMTFKQMRRMESWQRIDSFDWPNEGIGVVAFARLSERFDSRPTHLRWILKCGPLVCIQAGQGLVSLLCVVTAGTALQRNSQRSDKVRKQGRVQCRVHKDDSWHSDWHITWGMKVFPAFTAGGEVSLCVCVCVCLGSLVSLLRLHSSS